MHTDIKSITRQQFWPLVRSSKWLQVEVSCHFIEQKHTSLLESLVCFKEGCSTVHVCLCVCVPVTYLLHFES